MILACDNQTSQFYHLTGQGAALDLQVTKIDEKELDFSFNPLTSIWFEPTHPHLETIRNITIANNSPLTVPFH